MKILVVSQYYCPEPFRITDICETLVQRGHEITVLTGLPNYPEGTVLAEYRHGKKRDELVNGVHVIRCHEIGRGKNVLTRFLNYFSYPLSASRRIKSLPNDFDEVFVNQLSPVMMAWPALKYKKLYKKKVLLYCLDLWPASISVGGVKTDSFIYKRFLSISRKIYKSVDSIAITSMMFLKYFKETIGVITENITYLPQYAEEIFQPVEPKEKTNDLWNFVFAGNIGEAQSVETIIKAANELKVDIRIKFHIIGDGSSLDNCRKLADTFGLQSVIFYGRMPVTDMPSYYSMADAMLITMRNDNVLSYTLPGKVQSYMAAGKPIIGACCGEAKRVIEESGCGYCCEAENFLEFADRIRLFASGRSDIRSFADSSIIYYKNKYSKQMFISDLEISLKKNAIHGGDYE